MYLSSGLGCAGNCNKRGRGLGAIDLSTWSLEDSILVGLAAVALYAFGVFTPGVTAKVKSRFASKPRARRSKGGGSSEFLSSMSAAFLVLGAAYLGYQYFVSVAPTGDVNAG